MIVTAEIDYLDGHTLCRGFIAYEDSITTVMPGVLVAHAWEGRGERACNKARELAAMGYVGFAVDMYGEAKLGKDKAEKMALLTPLMENRAVIAQRMGAAYDVLCNLPQVDKNKTAAIGYCFGGLCVLDLVRSGADLKGGISFHGLLSAPEAKINTSIASKVLILHGYDDPLVTSEQIKQFAEEMTARRVDWQMHIYGLTAHAFTDPQANDDEMGLHYNAQSDRRSWQSAQLFFNELFS